MAARKKGSAGGSSQSKTAGKKTSSRSASGRRKGTSAGSAKSSSGTKKKTAVRGASKKTKAAGGKKSPAGKGKEKTTGKDPVPMPEDLHKRQWGKMWEVLEWLEADGYPISKKNLYEHYGPSAGRPVKRKTSGKDKGAWFYPELLERIRQNRDGALPSDYEAVNRFGSARAAAELRIKEAEARDRELSLAEKEGHLLRRDAVTYAANQLASAAESRRKSLCSTLPAMLEGRDVEEIHRVLEAKTRDLFAGLRTSMEEWARGK